MATLFKHVLEGMTDNNNINGAAFRDWNDADHAIQTYGDTFNGECEGSELVATVTALNMIIESDGARYDDAVNEWNRAVWGKTFSDNNGPVPFGG